MLANQRRRVIHFHPPGSVRAIREIVPLERTDLYQKVTDSILAQLEAGCVPWVRPWKSGVGAPLASMPFNMISKRNYSGINIPLLWMAGARFESNAWLTYKQAESLGGHVSRGERGTMVVYADKFIPKKSEDEKPVFFLKSFTVFNAAQCKGLPEAPVKIAPSMPEIHAEADAVIKATGARIVLGGDRAFYMPGADVVTMPVPAAFPDALDWTRVCFHEIAHWTGAPSRLDRTFGARFGDHAYAMEELVAEMSAAFTCASLGIVPTVRHADYLASWIAVLKSDKRAVVQAASKASKASDYVLACEAAEMREAA